MLRTTKSKQPVPKARVKFNSAVKVGEVSRSPKAVGARKQPTRPRHSNGWIQCPMPKDLRRPLAGGASTTLPAPTRNAHPASPARSSVPPHEDKALESLDRILADIDEQEAKLCSAAPRTISPEPTHRSSAPATQRADQAREHLRSANAMFANPDELFERLGQAKALDDFGRILGMPLPDEMRFVGKERRRPAATHRSNRDNATASPG